tara:strand:- start:16829 stop:16957 length:129 start_codon:yes stop_codon:yes gene_type:complete
MRLVYLIEALLRGERWAKRRALEGLLIVVVVGAVIAFAARYS